MECGASGASGASAQPHVELDINRDKDNVKTRSMEEDHVKGRQSRHGIALGVFARAVSYLVQSVTPQSVFS